MSEVASVEPRFLESPDGFKSMPPTRKAAWSGLLRLHADITRALEADLTRRHGIGLRGYAILDALSQAEDRHLRISTCAEHAQLSVSRASRLIDQLEAEGLVARGACAGDSRVVHVTITAEGCELLTAAQDTFLDVVEERYLGALSWDEVEQLGRLFTRLAS